MLQVLHGVDNGLEVAELDAAVDASAQDIIVHVGLTSGFASGKYSSWSGGN